MFNNLGSQSKIFITAILFGLLANLILLQTSLYAEDASSVQNSGLTDREMMLLERIADLEQRLNEVESKISDTRITPALFTNSVVSNKQDEPTSPVPENAEVDDNDAEDTESAGISDFFNKATINATLDGYYEYNFNKPVARLNLLRAYDVLSNSFSLNQAAVIIDRQPDAGKANTFGLRVDLQYGQATETVQGSAVNELRPQTYRPIWQAYGTYVAPIGNGLTFDFGKFAANLGYETNYTKDNWNYSRAYFFNFLPFYHFGVRAKYPVNDLLTLQYQLMNGIQQSEDFNSFKSQEFTAILTPSKSVSWQVNYYLGREQRDVVPILNPTFPTLPTQPGLPTQGIDPAPDGKFQAFDSYVTWYATENLTFALEGDYVTNRIEENSAKSVVWGGAFYARYQFNPIFALAGRAEYLSDDDGFFSGVSQSLKEATVTADFRIANGFILRGEWRRDFSNQPFFLTEETGVLRNYQNTIGAGLVWWIGGKEGAW